jgi:hypothetical protein
MSQRAAYIHRFHAPSLPTGPAFPTIPELSTEEEIQPLPHPQPSVRLPQISPIASPQRTSTFPIGTADLSTCRYCSRLNPHALSQPGGVIHASSRSSLVRSAGKCRLCQLFFRRDRSGRQRSGGRQGADSGHLVVSFERRDEDDDEVACLRVKYANRTGGSGEEGLVFWVFTQEGDPAQDYGVPVKRQLSSTASLESFTRAITWLGECCSTHACGQRIPLRNTLAMPRDDDDTMDVDTEFTTWPSRLIDVSSLGTDSASDVKLVDNLDGSKKQYITLSYCWGILKHTLRTTSRSLRLRKTRIHYSSMPRTFRDVVTIARRLGVQYVWIDALCIIQDDISDWERESVKMGGIYSLAYVTVAADAGEDSDAGCFNIKSSSQEEHLDSGGTTGLAPFELKSTLPNGTTSSIFLWDTSRSTRKASPLEIDGSPLSDRGWCCQERILSPRILHYTRTQLFWECRETLLAEDNLRPWTIAGEDGFSTVCGLARNLYGTTTNQEGLRRLLGIWYHQVVSQTYSRRKLTYPDDKLSAISGLARAFSRHIREPYLAGLWLTNEDLAWGLSWRCRRRTPLPLIAFNLHESMKSETGSDEGVTLPSAPTSFSSYGTTSTTSLQGATISSTTPKPNLAPLPPLYPSSYRAPSFAWSSLDAPIEWPPLFPSSHLTFLSHQVNLSSHDPFGRVSVGTFISVRGHVHQAKITRRRTLTTLSLASSTNGERGSVGNVWEMRDVGDDRWLGMGLLDDEEADVQASIVEYLVLGKGEAGNVVGLLIEKVEGDGEVAYRRKGIAEILGLDGDERMYTNDHSLKVLKLV